MLYEVARLCSQPKVNAEWEAVFWQKTTPIQLQNIFKKESDHFPKTEVKVAYDDNSIYVIFRVEDRYVRAVAEKYGDDVWKDSAVEFFFVPGMDLSNGYFNLEINCGGTALFHFQTMPSKDRILIDSSDFAGIQIANTMPKIIEQEFEEPTTWLVEYCLPFSILEKYSRHITIPAPGVKWRVNFYKIANESSHPHWLTWSYVKRTQQGFHNPAYFGTLLFR